jgi:hypothetical protein
MRSPTRPARRSGYGAPTPDGRKVVTVFTTSDVVAIDADGINFTDLPSPVSRGEVAA